MKINTKTNRARKKERKCVPSNSFGLMSYIYSSFYLLDHISCPTSSRHRNYATALLCPAADPSKPARRNEMTG